MPIPIFYVYLPGPLRDVERLVKVRGAKTYPSRGHLYLTTVSVDLDVTLLDWVTAAIDPQRTVVLRSQVAPGGSFHRLEKEQLALMRQSKEDATSLVLSRLGLGRPRGDGVKVTAVVPGAPASGVLRRGDEIASIATQHVSTPCDVTRVLDRSKPGQEISLTLQRDGKTKAVRVRASDNPYKPGSAFLGIGMTGIRLRSDSRVHPQFHTGSIAGPSAGLMFALALYDKLTPGDLTRGRPIAGTGTIDCAGKIGPIGGIEEKVAAAERKGAQVFLAPAANAAAAGRVAHDMKIIAVSSFGDALRDLRIER